MGENINFTLGHFGIVNNSIELELGGILDYLNSKYSSKNSL